MVGGYSLPCRIRSDYISNASQALPRSHAVHANRSTCSGCGHVLAELPLKVREWDCPKCCAHHDRDYNAAVNILRVGASTLGGGTVSPTTVG